MVSQAQSFVHLIANAADGSHNPQVFRMPCDQPLTKLAHAYSKFRGLSTDIEQNFHMSTQSHGDIDPAATAAVYGFTDGDQVIFASHPAAAKPIILETPAEAPLEPPTAALASVATQSSIALPRKAKVKPKAKGEPKSKAKGKTKAEAKAKAKPKAKAKVKAKAKMKATTITKAKAKAKAKTAAKAMNVVVAATSPMKLERNVAMTQSRDLPIPNGFTRSATVHSGPAKGWRVIAWLQDVTKQKKVGTHDSVIRWRIAPPDRSRMFTRFSSVQEVESEGVYTQLFTAVRPLLLRKISERRFALEHCTPKRRRRSKNEDALTPIMSSMPCSRRFQNEDVLTSSAQSTALSAVRAVYHGARSLSDIWQCDCVAHLHRHPRCGNAEHQQPPIIHLRNNMLIGRGESCDVVLNSRRMPQMISRCHAAIHCEEETFTIVDQGSLNGIIINGVRTQGKCKLADGDTVTFGVTAPQPEFDYFFKVRPNMKPLLQNNT